MRLKTLLKNLIKEGVGSLDKVGLVPNVVVVRMDGGICSQMHFYLVGEMLKRRGCDVRFDLSWFRECGKDMDGRFARNYDLERAFPCLEVKKASPLLCRLLKIGFMYHNDYFGIQESSMDWMEIVGPAYMDGYYRDSEEMYSTVFKQVFRVDDSVLDKDNLKLLNEIILANTAGSAVAVHVRRGDLSSFVKAYGAPASIVYFKKSVEYVRRISGEAKFFIFSDESDWCRNELPESFGDADFKICDINGSERGYCDMILMSHCRHHITSQGSLGKYAAMLRNERLCDGLVLLPPNEPSREWLSRFNNCKIVN